MIGANHWKVFHNWCLLIGAGASVVAGARQRFTLVHLSFAVSPGFPFDLESGWLQLELFEVFYLGGSQSPPPS